VLALSLLAAAMAAVAAALLEPRARRPPDQGAVHFLGGAKPAFERFIAHRDPRYGAFLRRHMRRMVAFSPHFDSRTRWYPNAWVYHDAYAIYPGSATAARHADWILRDGAGRPLFIPYECGHGSCPQYAGDISNPQFRRQWIAEASAKVRRGYRGLFIDDVNLNVDRRVSDGSGGDVAPIDRSTGQPMTYDAWRAYMAQFMEEVRKALPRTEIVHNVIWWADQAAGSADPYIRREIQAANVINLERGINDPGLTGGSGPFSLSKMFSYVDAVHALGRGVVLDGFATEPQGIEYALAGYLLISLGNDYVSAEGMTPEHWWPGFDVNLGRALGPRKRQPDGTLRREFARGVSILNEPGAPPRSVQLAHPMKRIDGTLTSSLTLGPASGAVLLNS
jgi:hypothetical protein